MLRLFSKRAHLAPHPFARKPLELRRFLNATGNVRDFPKAEQTQEAFSDAKSKHPIPTDDPLANNVQRTPVGDHLIHPETDFRKLESNITKATRDLSSKTDANIANTHRVLMSQIESTRNDLRLEIETNRHKLSLEMAQYHLELMSQMAKNSQGPEPQVPELPWLVRDYPALKGMLFGVALVGVPMGAGFFITSIFS